MYIWTFTLRPISLELVSVIVFTLNIVIFIIPAVVVHIAILVALIPDYYKKCTNMPHLSKRELWGRFWSIYCV